MKQESRESLFLLGHAASLGISMVVAIFGSLFFGFWLDDITGQGPVFTYLFLFFGIAAAFRNVYVLYRRFAKDDTRRDG